MSPPPARTRSVGTSTEVRTGAVMSTLSLSLTWNPIGWPSSSCMGLWKSAQYAFRSPTLSAMIVVPTT